MSAVADQALLWAHERDGRTSVTRYRRPRWLTLNDYRRQTGVGSEVIGVSDAHVPVRHPPHRARKNTPRPDVTKRVDPLSLHEGELSHLRDVPLKEVRTSDQIVHVAVVDLLGGHRDGIVAGGFQLLRPGIECPNVVGGHLLQCLRLKTLRQLSIR